MNRICRFCLRVSNEEMCKLKECDIFLKIRSWLPFQISTDELFPGQLCKECINKIKEINEFCSSIKENEYILQQCSNMGSLQDYYLTLTNNINVKEEKNECIIICETKYLKNEDSNGQSEKEINVEKIKDSKNQDININLKESDNIKCEESADEFSNNTACSSDDEITLSSVKNEKELQTKTPDNTLKRKRKLRPNKIIKIKKVFETQKSSETNTDFVKQFTCLTCVKLCGSQTELIEHYHTEHLVEHKNKQNFTENEIDGAIIFKCDSCDKTLKFKKDMIKHVAIHNDERPLICKLCGRTYKTVAEIIRHARVHNGFKLQCSYKCGYSTAYQGALKEHENRHLDVYKYACEKCGKGFYVKTWYEQHQNVHTGLKPFICDICGLGFHMDRYLTSHRSSMHPQSSSVKRYICVHCNQKCDSANSLALHLAEHGINKEKEFLCDFCGKILASADQLKYHHRMHSGLKPYSCSICNKSFAKKFNVKVHMSGHSGEKTHACARCGKLYTQRSTLLRHVKRFLHWRQLYRIQEGVAASVPVDASASGYFVPSSHATCCIARTAKKGAEEVPKVTDFIITNVSVHHGNIRGVLSSGGYRS